MYAAAPKKPAIPAIMRPGKMTRQKISDRRREAMRLLAYQYGAYDTMEEASAFDMQQDVFAGLEEEMAKELARPVVPKARHIPMAHWWLGDADDNGMSPESDYVGGAFTAEDVAADVQQDQFAANAPTQVVAGAAGRALRRRERRLIRRGGFDYDRNLGIAPVIAEGVHIAAGFIHGSSTGSSNQATDRAAQAARSGDPSGLAFVVKQGGFTSNGGWRGAVGKGADYYARGVLNSLIDDGTVIGPRVDTNSWTTLPGGGKANIPSLWKLAPKGLIPGAGTVLIPSGPPGIIPTVPPGVALPTAPPPVYATPGTPAPAPGTSLIDQIRQAFSPSPAPTVNVTLPPTAPGEAPPAGPQRAGLFGGGDDSMKYLMLAGIGLFAISLVTKKS